MGQDKRFLAVGDETLFARSLAVLRSVFERVVIVIAQDSPSIESDVLVFLDPGTIKHFVALKDEGDVVMAKLQNGFQPMHALYHRNCLPVMEQLIQAKDFT